MIVFMKFVVLLMIVNDDPLSTKRVNRPEGHLHVSVVFKKISRSLASLTIVNDNPLLTIVFLKVIVF